MLLMILGGLALLPGNDVTAKSVLKVGPMQLCRPGVVDASVIKDEFEGTEAVSIRLDDRATAAFALLTKNSVGKQLAITLNGAVISAPYVNEPIASGEFLISNVDQQVREQVVAAVSAPC